MTDAYVQAMIGREQSAHDICALPLAQRLAALLDQDPAALREGDPLPFGWHGILFAPVVPSADLSVDGTASDTTFLATPDDHPRRMAGGRRIHQIRPIRIGSKLQRRSIITSVAAKSGRSGSMIVATVRHEIGEAGTVSLVEEIDTIFLQPVDSRASPRASKEKKPVQRIVMRTADRTFGSVDLFRFSSVVFNAHRIHYDLRYAKDVEGYPELVVNGSVSAVFLCEFCRQTTGWSLKKIRTRNLAPLFANTPVRLCLGAVDGELLLWVENEDGASAVEIDILEHRE